MGISARWREAVIYIWSIRTPARRKWARTEPPPIIAFIVGRMSGEMCNGPAIVIDGECPTWPTGPQALTGLPADREHERAAFWFGFRLAPAGNEVRFRITGEAIRRMPEDTPRRRGERLVAALLTWLGNDPERRLEALNDFQVYVSDAGDTRIEPYCG